MQVVEGMHDHQGSMTIGSMAFRVRSQALKWSARRTLFFVAASSTLLWSAIATAAWFVI
jgi:hypothetical protein